MQVTSQGSAGRIDVDDADAYPETMGQWDMELRQISAGKFHGRTEYVKLGGLMLYRVHWSRRSIVTATTPVDSFMIACSRSGQPEIEFCSQYLQYDRLGFCHPGSEVTGVTPDSNEHVAVEVPMDLLQQILPGEDVAEKLRFNQHMKTDADSGARFIQMIDRTISTYLEQAEQLNDARECRAIAIQVMDQLTDLILQHSTGKDDTSGLTRHEIFSRALDTIHKAHGPVTLSELAAALETTPRSLQRAFKESLGISPLKYLRLSRMNACHKALRKTNRSSATVTDIALEWGFRELGRFACEYRQLFGESPVTTLARDCGPPPGNMYTGIRN